MLEKNPSKRLGATELLKKYFDKNSLNIPISIQIKPEKNDPIKQNTLGL